MTLKPGITRGSKPIALLPLTLPPPSHCHRDLHSSTKELVDWKSPLPPRTIRKGYTTKITSVPSRVQETFCFSCQPASLEIPPHMKCHRDEAPWMWKTHQTKGTQRWGSKAKDKLHVEENEDYTSTAEEVKDKQLNKSGNSQGLI